MNADQPPPEQPEASAADKALAHDLWSRPESYSMLAIEKLIAAHVQRQLAAVRCELESARADKARLDWLEGELDREQQALATQTEAQIPVSLFRLNNCITRAAIDAAMACSDCGGQGWWAKYPANGDPPEQIQCEKCYGTGAAMTGVTRNGEIK